MIYDQTIPVASLVFVVSAVLVLSCRQTDRITHRDSAKHLTPTTVIGVSNNYVLNIIYVLSSCGCVDTFSHSLYINLI